MLAAAGFTAPHANGLVGYQHCNPPDWPGRARIPRYLRKEYTRSGAKRTSPGRTVLCAPVRTAKVAGSLLARVAIGAGSGAMGLRLVDLGEIHPLGGRGLVHLVLLDGHCASAAAGGRHHLLDAVDIGKAFWPSRTIPVPPILPSQLGASAGVIGAASVCMSEVFFGGPTD
jgi:hypothetical protein